MSTTLQRICALAAALLPLLALGCGATGAESDEETAAIEEEALFEASPLGPEPQGVATKFPILLTHGFGGSSTSLMTFSDAIVEALRADGHVVIMGNVPPFAPVAVRAKYLAQNVDDALAATGATKINIVAHSMGGLDARALVSQNGYGDRVASVTTIATPHQGSFIADVAIGLTSFLPEDALNAIAAAIGSTYSDLAAETDLHAALYDVSEYAAEDFNEMNPDDPAVVYQSWAGVSSFACLPNPNDGPACDGMFDHHFLRSDCLDPVLIPAMPFVAHGGELRSNDGFVTVQSAHWGNFRGCVPADHADEVGQFFDQPMDLFTGFDPARFYRNLAFDLASQGF